MQPDPGDGLRFGRLGDRWVHLCVDMQRMFAEPTEWHAPWLRRILPNVVSLVAIDPARTIFTRFVPPASPADVKGSWHRYYARWHHMTRSEMDPGLIDLVPELAAYLPPALVEDKPVMSPWFGTLHARLQQADVEAIVVSGTETEVCVLATVMGGIDLGYRMVLVTDAMCSGADETHDAMMRIYHSRFGMQVETVSTAGLVASNLDGDMR